MELNKTIRCCPWNSDQNCTQNSARGDGIKGGVGVGILGWSGVGGLEGGDLGAWTHLTQYWECYWNSECYSIDCCQNTGGFMFKVHSEKLTLGILFFPTEMFSPIFILYHTNVLKHAHYKIGKKIAVLTC